MAPRMTIDTDTDWSQIVGIHNLRSHFADGNPRISAPPDNRY
jgi:hypothetical protein